MISNQYKPLTRFLDTHSFYSIILRNLLIISLPIFYLDIARFLTPKFIFWIIFLSICLFLQIGYRVLIKDLIDLLIKKYNRKERKNVVIYKADYLGFQLSNLLKSDGKYEIVCFLDDSPSLEGSSINAIPIKSISKFNKKRYKIDQFLIASESYSINKLKNLIKDLEKDNISILRFSPINKFKDLKEKSYFYPDISQQEILGRQKVRPIKKLLKASVNEEISVCINGAGGSIGSEICRQVAEMNPKYLIMIDFSEYNLFKINAELSELKAKETILIPKIINTEDKLSLIKTFKSYKVNLVFHAAAYKHVELIELNPIAGLKNNLLSTKSICEAAIESKIQKLILISSDKAVRPTNIMGGTKFLSELIIKKFSEQGNNYTKFAVVRFGNVIDSSGSVIPIFREQIKNGGPVTVTDPKMERFFMTISEAVHLVLQASVIANGGETYILNMGKPVKIIEIAKRMIISAGLKIKEHNKNGDIEIKIIGMKKGEKLNEELIFNGKTRNTIHPLINKADEKINLPENLFEIIDEIILLSNRNENDKALKIFSNLIKNYK
ncbi:polysaccharide biosynthesis protein [Prochlorococcus marinus XMU1410]|uniref:polysaccharide biosynthesis protein n=1 Tax=Prochlorococcus marinus TaxID=1219 RepID=UPI001ADA8AE7|nr:polysaccharide biosynthesis protein [Prochlorococcus marinus]MBO8242377.1 polysaccharide biosynthesis protein [Prochlorococcus marinus XMU1410]